MKRKISLLLVLAVLVSVFAVVPTAYAAAYRTLEPDTTSSFELPSNYSYWKTEGGYKYYKAGNMVISMEVTKTLKLADELSALKNLGISAGNDTSKDGVKCVYGLQKYSDTITYGFIRFNSKSHGIRLLVSFNPGDANEVKAFEHIITTLKVFDPKADGWAYEGGYWLYYLKNKPVTGWKEIDGCWYHFTTKGHMETGWIKLSGKWYLLNEDGVRQTGWYKSGTDWYYLKSDGVMATGWILDGTTWYFFKATGELATGWVQDGKTWYYINDDYSIQTGWMKAGDNWYYMATSGAMVTGWMQVNDKWYYFKDTGEMLTGWFEDKDAEKKLPAKQKKELWYWFDDDGSMVTGWKEINGQWEMFDDNGLWLYTWQE